MIIDGCRDCGTFWFDADEMGIVKQSLSIKGTTKEELSASQKAEKADMEELHLAAKMENCMHFEERGMPPALEQCKRPKHRGTEYCYMHQPK